MTELRQRWYATRSGHGASTDEDRAMAHQQFGPYDHRADVRTHLIAFLRSGGHVTTSIGRMFVSQYAGLLAELALHPEANIVIHEGVQWTIWHADVAVGDDDVPNADDPEVGGLQDETTEAAQLAGGPVVTNVSDLSPAMRAALVSGTADQVESPRGPTIRALRRRGLLGAYLGRGSYALTDAGRRIRTRLLEG